MSDLKSKDESLESLLSTAIGLLMGHKDRIGYKPGSVIAKFVDECVERLKDWPYTTAAQPSQAGQLHQALTDPENQPNQYGVEFLMHGPKFAFKVGAQQFTLDYEPTEPGEFEFMRDMLIHAFTTFTPDVKTAQAGQVPKDMKLVGYYHKAPSGDPHEDDFFFADAINGDCPHCHPCYMDASVIVHPTPAAWKTPMTEADLERITRDPITVREAVRAAERHHGIVGKEGA